MGAVADGRCDLEAATAVAVEEGGEHARRVEVRQAKPVDRSFARNEGDRSPVADPRVVLDRGPATRRRSAAAVVAFHPPIIATGTAASARLLVIALTIALTRPLLPFHSAGGGRHIEDENRARALVDHPSVVRRTVGVIRAHVPPTLELTVEERLVLRTSHDEETRRALIDLEGV